MRWLLIPPVTPDRGGFASLVFRRERLLVAGDGEGAKQKDRSQMGVVKTVACNHFPWS